jgi:hypothetical protein
VPPSRFPRPTLRCLRSDLDFKKLPPSSTPLSAIDHILLRKAAEVTRSAPSGAERIKELDDRVYWKVKMGRWRGALQINDEESWLVAAGHRKEGDADDFYRELGAHARAWKADYNKTHSPPITTDAYTESLQPTIDDRDRLLLEMSAKLMSDLNVEMPNLIREAFTSNVEARGEAGGCDLGVLMCKGPFGEVYVFIRIVDRAIESISQASALVLDAIPAIADRAGWFIEPMPERELEPGEICWSNIIDEAALKEFLRTASK